MELKVLDFGVSEYRDIWTEQCSIQSYLVGCKKEHIPVETEYLLVGEHPSVYTIGFHGDITNLKVSEEELNREGVECIRIERGGDITYHGPGQMIAYPIIDLENHGLGVKGYVALLEDCVIRLLEEYGIKGESVEGATGVWIGKGTDRERKICAIGVKCTRFITMHGLALNVNTDLTAFNAINPCGFTDKGVTSISAETGSQIDMNTLKEKFVAIFKELHMKTAI